VQITTMDAVLKILTRPSFKSLRLQERIESYMAHVFSGRFWCFSSSRILRVITMPAAPALNFLPRLLLLTAALIMLLPPMSLAQKSAEPCAASPPLADACPAHSFEVATIKPSQQGPHKFFDIVMTPVGMDASSASLTMLVAYAYGLRSAVDQVSGVPDWAKTDLFDVQAKMSAADIAEVQKLSYEEGTARLKPMLQTLLAERFKLKVHSETKQVPVYELVVAKGGAKLKDAATDPNPPLGKRADGKLATGIRFLKDTGIVQMSLTSFVSFLSQPVARIERPVLDKTGLIGSYYFTLNWSVYSNGAGSSPGPPEDSTVSIFGALQEVGLKLRPATGPIDIIVIDHVEHPSEN